jgi:PAS domain S-box-containing protein
MTETDRLTVLLEEEKKKNLLLLKELQQKKDELESLLNNSEYNTYRTVIESANDIIFKTDLKGNFTFVNPAAENKTGYLNNELIGMHFMTVIRDDHRNRIQQTYIDQYQSQLKTSYSEFPFISKSGNEIWVGQNVQPIFDTENNIVGFTAITRDITERIKSQEQLHLLNTRFESIVNNLDIGLVLEDTNRKTIMTNQKFCTLFKYEIDPIEMIGFDCYKYLENAEDLFLNGRKQIELFNGFVDEKITQLAHQVPLSDGRVLECDYIPLFVDSIYSGHLWKYTDVSDRINAQRILVQNEEKYRLIIQNMNLGLLVVDNDGIIVDSNPSFSGMTGYTSEELIGKSAVAIFTPGSKEQTLGNVTDLRKKGVSSAYELNLKNKSGENIWMLISGSPIFDANNNVNGSIGIHLDITERKEQMIELMVARKKAEELAYSKEIFLANMSHEIRTPMNAIIGMARLLEEMPMSAKQTDYIDAIKISSENLLVIINDILDFSKIDLGKLELEESNFNFFSFIRNIMVQFEVKAHEKNLVFKNQIDSDISEFFVSDPGRLAQIISNLISNSIKFTHEGGVDLNCELLRESAENQVLRFTVSDTGIGIEQENKELIFESFMQEHSSINRKYGGTGLGLSISRQLVKLFKSDMTVITEKGKGSAFSFEIELKKGIHNSAIIAAEKIIDTSVLKETSVLLAEDNKTNQLLARVILENLGMIVSIANNGYEAIELLLDNEYDIILMDLQMPLIDGLSATKIIRSKLRSNIPVIALTANAIIGDKEKCIAAGMDDYISKPFDKHELAQKMLRLIIKKSSKIEPIAITNKHIDPIYDLTRLREQSSHDEAFVLKLLELFCELITETIQNIDEAIASKNLNLVKGYAHKIKASIDLLEITELKNKVRQIEDPKNISEESYLLQINYFKDSLKYVQLLLKKNELLN